jgi:hypothetical protein
MTRANYRQALCAILLTGLLASCGSGIEVTTTAPNLALSVSSCKEKLTGPGPAPTQKVRWIDASTLEVKARGDLLCETDRVSAAYAVSRKSLELGYAGSFSAVKAAKPPPQCYCMHDFAFVISNLDKRSYMISVENIPRDGTSEKWKSRRLK